MTYLSQDKDRRSCYRVPLLCPVHLMADSGQILIGTTQNLGRHGLRAEVAKSIERDSFVIFRFSHKKASVRGDGRVVWSGSSGGKYLCGITFSRMKQKDKESLNEILDCVISPRCPVCRSKIRLEELIRFFVMQPPYDEIGHRKVLCPLEMARLCNLGLTGEAVLEKILGVIKSYFRAKAVKLLLYNNKTGILEPNYHLGGPFVEKFSLVPDQSIVSKAFTEGNVLFIPDVRKDPYFVYDDHAEMAGIHSMVAIPLVVEGKGLGVLSLFTPLFDQKETLTKQEKELLSAFGKLMALAMKIEVPVGEAVKMEKR